MYVHTVTLVFILGEQSRFVVKGELVAISKPSVELPVHSSLHWLSTFQNRWSFCIFLLGKKINSDLLHILDTVEEFFVSANYKL